ncbi:MAG TPA: bifunctional demethylmenaquinone methyltransferase/2-methoxy-6-polyprenyl-1,4-benzoquinol methylase UbiE [Bacteroidota bacterium]|nr:bifunctional demethylmenaquinone methyltransferase/2-methoxy-6-polyprenyl-1,4-benzoquinol methylase UbiE [Bacteroidota bacterium]
MTQNPDLVNSPIESAPAIRRMFNTIAPTYDRLNHLLSLGRDIRWRKKAIALLRDKQGGRFLDLACGSGDLSLEALSLHPSRIVATDFAENMLDVFRRKLSGLSPGIPVDLVAADVHALPFPSSDFDVAMVAFGIRNFADRLGSLREMHRVLKPGGKVLILELTTPTAPLIRHGYLLYGRFFLPMIGRLVSGHSGAYNYLPESIEQFPENDQFLRLMTSAGFSSVRAISLSFGTATIFLGSKA